MGETLETAARREAWEELGLTIAVGPLAALVRYGPSWQYYFWGESPEKDFGPMTGPERYSRRDSSDGSYQAIWLPAGRLEAYDVRPRAVIGLISSGGGEASRRRSFTVYDEAHR